MKLMHAGLVVNLSFNSCCAAHRQRRALGVMSKALVSADDFRRVSSQTYRVGDRVTQATLGEGTVISVDTTHTTVDFDRRGVRRLVSERATLVAVKP